MALTTTFPASPQGDLYLTHFLSQTGEEETSLFLHRTLAPEWFPQSGVQLTWPHAGTDWAYMLPEVTQCYLRLAYEIAIREPLLIVAPDVAAVRALIDEKLPQRATERITYHACPTNDTWARDHAFITLLPTDTTTPQPRHLLDFRFNAWGGKFEATLDNDINRQLHAVHPTLSNDTYEDHLDFELEGGSIESDGQGTILTTAQCNLNPNRRHTTDDVETELKRRLHAQRILWLHHGGLEQDDTDAHIDTLARLCPNDTIIYSEGFPSMHTELQAMRTPQGRPYHLVSVPKYYANFLIINRAVLVPTYAVPDDDQRALQAISTVFPDREIIGIDCRILLTQKGSLHCCTMQYPSEVIL